jgi:hypothetical protein
VLSIVTLFSHILKTQRHWLVCIQIEILAFLRIVTFTKYLTWDHISVTKLCQTISSTILITWYLPKKKNLKFFFLGNSYASDSKFVVGFSFQVS